MEWDVVVPELMLPVMPAVRTHTKARKMGKSWLKSSKMGTGDVGSAGLRTD